MELSLIQDYVTALMLHFVRVGAFVAVLPLLAGIVKAFTKP